MPFSIRPFCRFPVCCPMTYYAGLFEGEGIVWSLSMNGWQLALSSALPNLIQESLPCNHPHAHVQDSHQTEDQDSSVQQGIDECDSHHGVPPS